MLARAAAHSVIALLLGGALATRGWAGLLSPWDWAVPYLAGFLALEVLLRRSDKNAARVFGLGAAFALLYEGVYGKSVIDGLGFFGVELGAVAAACFDWGMLAVIATHLLSRRFPRERDAQAPGLLASLPAGGLLAVLGGLMVVVYLVKTWFGHYIAERGVGPTWLLTDVVFFIGAVALARQVLAREDAAPPLWTYVLCAFAVCAPAMQALFAWSFVFAWPAPLTFMLSAAWLFVCVLGFRNLWVARADVDETPLPGSPFILYAAAWRLVGSAVILMVFQPAFFDERAANSYALLVDLPSRALFAYAFLTSRLDV